LRTPQPIKMYTTLSARQQFAQCSKVITELYFSMVKPNQVLYISLGKTYTMQGDRNDPGILYHSLKEIFDTRDRHHEKKIKIYISYLEIYNEGLIDLLNPKGDPTSLKIAEDAKVAGKANYRLE
jgi:hypothetical protein